MNGLGKELEPNNFFGLHDKVILITGAAGQIGSGIVNACLAAGASVVACDADLGVLQKTSTKYDWPKESVALAECDIRKREDIQSSIKIGVERFGQISSLVNNAGVSVFEPFLERTESSIEWVMDVNIKGTILCIQEFVKHRQEYEGSGEIVNIASHYGLVSPDPRIYTDCARRNSEIYGATKAGIIQMTRYFAVHLSENGIRTNGVAPGGVRDPDNPQGDDFQKNYAFRCPMNRMAETHEIVGAIVFLLSPSASYINGQTIVVDGGTTAW